ncbi:hypothetical protein Q4561_03300 [Alteromonas sp. 1_MG-2023]|uniref:hypothetical protein n=1 Tax=Alteromonas sp. 1_MG-2023 TaxID=3062669 RepID=UPI0026E35178|nr:hypothetical protein [Alteromonas sp. 1_MG-2023]MDO6566074.1 hypothetical protein [Alteromonas sp. 1_MG-2023]
MEEVIVGEVAKGLFRVIGYLVMEFFFWTICYWIGWPICRAVTFGAYPKQNNVSEEGSFGGSSSNQHSGAWCALVGLAVVVSVFFFVITHF